MKQKRAIPKQIFPACQSKGKIGTNTRVRLNIEQESYVFEMYLRSLYPYFRTLCRLSSSSQMRSSLSILTASKNTFFLINRSKTLTELEITAQCKMADGSSKTYSSCLIAAIHEDVVWNGQKLGSYEEESASEIENQSF